jgi:dTMP kinase
VSETPWKFLSIEGGDGAGKTTTSRLVYEQLARSGKPAVLIHPNYPHCENEEARKFFTAMLPALRTPRHLLGRLQWVRLTSVWFDAVGTHVVRPSLVKGDIVVADTWYYKRLAHFALQGLEVLREAQRCSTDLCVPALVCMLDVSPEVAAERKGSFSFAETGNFEAPRELTRANFLEYQGRLRTELRGLARAGDWLTLSSQEASPEQNAHRIVDELGARGWI